jgi:hypothetical protein
LGYGVNAGAPIAFPRQRSLSTVKLTTLVAGYDPGSSLGSIPFLPTAWPSTGSSVPRRGTPTDTAQPPTLPAGRAFAGFLLSDLDVQDPVFACAASTGFDCDEPRWRRTMLSTISTPTEWNSHCQFCIDWNQNCALTRNSAAEIEGLTMHGLLLVVRSGAAEQVQHERQREHSE